MAGLRLLPWLKLLRIAALPSALSNILVGYLLAHQSWQPILPLVLLLIASACLYCSGMVLNDVFDVEVDRKQRPNRPLPSAAISPSQAKAVGMGLLLAGPVLAALASPLSLGIAAALAALVYLYDGPLKRTPIAPLLMGGCRSLNILLGASTIGVIPAVVLWYAVAIGVFVAGVTWLAKREADKTQSLTLMLPGSVLMVIGLVLVFVTAWRFAPSDPLNPRLVYLLPIAIALIAMPILRRLLIAWSVASGKAIQATVISSLRSLIIFDACLGLLVANGRPLFSAAILGLIAVSLLLGRVTKLT